MQYCEMVDSVQPMMVSKELFYTDNQMKELAESAKQEMGEYSLIEDLMARIVGKRFGAMKAEDVKAVMGKPGEGAEGGKYVKRKGAV